MRIAWLVGLVTLAACTTSGDDAVVSPPEPPPAPVVDAPPPPSATPKAPAPPPPPTALEVRDAMRRVFRYEVSISHSYLIATMAGRPTATTTARMTKNEDDLGAIFTSLFGADAGAQVATSFRSEGAAVRAGFDAFAHDDAAALGAASSAWAAAMNSLASAVHAVVPRLPRSELERQLDNYNEKTYGYAAARHAANDTLESTELDSLLAHVIDVADMLSDGIVAHFPEGLPSGSMAAHFAVRRAWEEDAIWMRATLLDVAVGSTAAATAKGWLDSRQDVIVASLGQPAGSPLSDKLHERVAIATQLFDAMRTGDAAGVEAAKTRWHANADATGPLLSATNTARVLERLHAEVDRTTAEAAHVFDGASPTDDIADYDAAMVEAFALADLLSGSPR